jgi:GNAT superfamily N-acetyltransferase
LRIQRYEGQYFSSLVDTLVELDQHYFGPNGKTWEQIRDGVTQNLLGAGSGVDVLVAIESDEVVGIATISLLFPAPDQFGQLFMKDLFIRQPWRGRGIGKAMMQFIAAHALNLNCTRLDWTTEESNSSAISFYDSLGANRVPEKIYFRLAGEEIAALARSISTTCGPGKT